MMRVRAGRTGALAALALMMTVPVGGMQQSGGSPFSQNSPVTPASQSGAQPSSRQLPAVEDDVPNPMGRSPQEQMRTMNAARQKQIVADTDKLLNLALELKSEVDKSSKDTLSLDVVKKADEIEKLAHSVKEKMRN